MNTKKPAGEVTVVTGASKGIAAAIARLIRRRSVVDIVERFRLDIFYIVDRGRNRVLAEGRNLLRHLIGGKAPMLPDNGHDRDVDLGKNIGRRVFDRARTEKQNEQRHHNEGVWTPQS